MAMQRRTVELGQNIYAPELGIEAVTDRYINQSIFARQGHRWLCAILGKGKQACSRSTSHDDGECFILKRQGVHCSLRGLGDAVFGFTHLASV